MSDDGARPPKLGVVLVVVLILGSVGATAYWLNRPEPETAPVAPPPEADVFCSGRIDAAKQVIALEPSAAGRVVEIYVAEGDVVKADQDVIRLDSSAAEFRLAQAKASVEAAQVELDAAKADQQRFPKQVEMKKHLIAAASARVDAVRKALQQRVEQKSVTPLGNAEKEALEAQITELEELEKAEKKQLQELEDREAKGQGTALRVRGMTAKLKAAQADEQLAAKAVAECVIKAPTAGTILRLQATKGGLIAPATYSPPIIFAPAGPVVLRAEVDQESLNRVKVGMAAEVTDENHPEGQVWKGKVTYISPFVAQRRALVLDPGEINDVRTVECVIALESPTEGLWIGQRMRVRILRGAAAR
jgi:multidrug resistance efflux pump